MAETRLFTLRRRLDLVMHPAGGLGFNRFRWCGAILPMRRPYRLRKARAASARKNRPWLSPRPAVPAR